MRLVNCGPGEWSDRLTILALKILVGSEQGRDVSHFKAEQAALLTSIRSRTLNGRWFEAVLELGAVNASLWHAEDDLRQLRKVVRDPETHGIPDLITVAQQAFKIQSLNDRRASLVQTINKDAGEGEIAEKI